MLKIIDFVGQESTIVRLRVLMLDHSNVLLRGPFGCGKTELARWYCYSQDPDFREHVCDGGKVRPPEGAKVVFLDEIHKLSPEEAWYQWPGTLVGATTEGAPIAPPMMSRMVPVWLEPYDVGQIEDIIDQRCPIPPLGRGVVARRVRGTPRTAIQVATQVAAWSKFHRYWPQTEYEYGQLVEKLGYYAGGFTEQDKLYLEFVHHRQPVSLDTIAKGTNLPKEMVSDEIEPFLIRKNLLNITGKGRFLKGVNCDQ